MVLYNVDRRSHNILPLQEYFFKSQESLATVIDFVDEFESCEEDSNKTKAAQDSGTSSTHSSPREPASRRRDNTQQPPRKLTP